MVVMMIVVGIVLSVIGYVIASIADFSFSSVSRYGEVDPVSWTT
jgi:hypothetical protein